MFRFDGDGRTDRASLQDDVGEGVRCRTILTTFRFDGDGRTDRASLQDDVGGGMERKQGDVTDYLR